MTNANVEFKKLFNVIVIKQLGNYHAVTCTSERFKPVFEMGYSIASFRFVEYVLGGKYIVCLLFIRFFFSSFRVSVLCAFSSYFFASRTDQQHTHFEWSVAWVKLTDSLNRWFCLVPMHTKYITTHTIEIAFFEHRFRYRSILNSYRQSYECMCRFQCILGFVSIDRTLSEREKEGETDKSAHKIIVSRYRSR